MNMFIRSRDGFKVEADKARVMLRAAMVVASDETGVRIEGTNSYHWVFHCKDAVVHQPDHTRRPRRRGDDGRACSGGVDIGSLFSAAKTWRAASNLRRASGARHGLRAGAWRGRFAVSLQAVVWQGVRSGRGHREFSPPRRSPGKSANSKAALRRCWLQRPVATSPDNCKRKSRGRETSC